jgi:hypothetical protein
MIYRWILFGWSMALFAMGLFFTFSATYVSYPLSAVFSGTGTALGLTAILGTFVVGAFGSLEDRVKALEERQRDADARLVPVSVRTDPPLPPPPTDIQSSRTKPQD